MPARSIPCAIVAATLACLSFASLAACKRSEPAPNPLQSQHDAMERAKDVGNTMQKGVDAEGKRADEEGK
jgi:hypothetical protein